MAKHLKKSGFNFVGTTICYAFMQATGMVNDHLVSCFRHEECRQLGQFLDILLANAAPFTSRIAAGSESLVGPASREPQPSV